MSSIIDELLFLRSGSNSFDSIFRRFSRFFDILTICDISLADRERCDKNRYPRGEILSSSGFSRISLAIDSISSSPSNVIFERRVFDFFSESVA